MSLKDLGDHYRGFIVKTSTPIEELKCHLLELVHEKTGAEVMHIACDDSENLFSLSFKTLPSSSNGAPHVLEHIVLCGSEKFPIKDPFFSMMRRSLNTFMNALTGADFTCYPAATQVEKDFYNLLEVYLDAVFHPELKQESFWQEGIRFEFSKPDDPTSSLRYQGIVYNEMKGLAFSPDNRIWHEMMERLVPDTPYAFASGGDPKVIPSLTYEDLKTFHAIHYHPSRCLFFFYGNFPLKNHLDFLLDQVLDKAKKASPLTPMLDQKRFTEHQSYTLPYPAPEGDLAKQFIVSVGFLMMPAINQEDLLTLALVDAILMDTDASPLKLALIESKLTVQADAFLDPDSHEVPYLIICKGCRESDKDHILSLIEKTLKKIVKEGIPEVQIDAALHQLEFNRSEIGSSHSPFGLTLFMRAALAKQHHCPPENALIIHSLFAQLRERMKDPLYLPSFIEKYFLHNTHQVRILFSPDATLIAREIEEETNILKVIEEGLTESEKEAIVRTHKRLDKYQKQVEGQSIDCLPKVSLSDVPSHCKGFDLQKTHYAPLTVYHHGCFTNQIVYATLFFDISALTPEELSYVPLFLSLVTETGSAHRNWQEQTSFLHAYTGGISAGTHLNLSLGNAHQAHPSFYLKGKCLSRHTDKLFQALKDITLSPRFDEKERIKELILQMHSHLEMRVQKNALRYATQLSLSGFGMSPYLQHLWGGMHFYQFLTNLVSNLDQKLESLLTTLQTLQDKLLTFHNIDLVLSCSDEDKGWIEREDFFGLKNLPKKPFTPWINHYPSHETPSQIRTLPTLVAFTSMAFNTILTNHPDAPALSLSTLLFDHLVLHPQIREQGGAYGSGASYNSSTGTFHFYSYRDPFIQRTLKTFETAIKEVSSMKFTEEDLEEAKLGIIQHLDIPVSPGQRASVAYLWIKEGKTEALRQEFREKLLKLTKKDIAEAVKRHLFENKPVIVSFANQDLVDKESVLAKSPIPLVLLPFNAAL